MFIEEISSVVGFFGAHGEKYWQPAGVLFLLVPNAL